MFVRILSLLLTLTVSALYAQQGRAGLSGTITDTSNAAVPNAQVTVRNVGTNVTTETRTNDRGLYTFPALSVGAYELSVVADGFKRAVQSSITLEVDQRAQINVQLEVGGTTESVVVTAEVPLVDVASATVGKVVENRRIQELPLNGRNALALTLLTPAVRSNAGPTNSGFGDRGLALTAISINGGANGYNNFIMDGGNNNRAFRGDINISPTVDAIQEFKVQSNVMSSEFGFTLGGVVNVVTKSGTNELHGSLYHFFRNDKLDARNAFADVRAPFRYNQFGGAVGGPVIRNRTFFFYNYEDWRFRRNQQPITTVPTMRQRNGDFSDLLDAQGRLIQLYDPLTTRPATPSGVQRDAFPGNILPQSRLDPTTRAFLRFFPEPNRTPVNQFTQQLNYIGLVKESRSMRQHTAKVDHRFSERHNIFGRYSYFNHFTDGPNNAGNPWPDPLVRARIDDMVNQNAVLNDTFTVAPNLLNEFRISLARHWLPFQAASFGQNLPRELGLHPSIPSDTLPVVQTGFANFGPYTVGLMASTTWQIFESATWIINKHQIKFGGEFRLLQGNNFQRDQPSYSFNFAPALTQNPRSPGGTGNTFATFLLGHVSTANAVQYLGLSMKGASASGFVQDDWKISRRLNLNIGLRWDFQQWPYERNNGVSNFDPTSRIPGINLLGRTTYGGIDFERSGRQSDWNNFSPRIGFAYDLDGKGQTVIRGGYAIFYPSIFANRFFGSTSGFANTATQYVPAGGDTNYPAFRFRDGLPSAPQAPLGSLLGPAAFLGQNVTWDQQQENVPMSQQWSLSLQEQIKGWLVDATYSANRGTHLPAGNYSINEIAPQDWNLGLALQDRVPNPYAGVVPGALGAATITRQQALRPFPYYNSVAVREPLLGNSTYHALLLTVERRFSRGLVVLMSFTGGKLMSDSVNTSVNFGNDVEQVGVVGYQDGQYNRALEHSLDPTDVSRRMVLSTIYELPFGKGRALSSGNRVLNTVIGGWQVNNITTWQNGLPVVVRGAQNFRADRPNSTGVSARLDNPTAAAWFDTTQFVNPPNFTLGNVGRTLPDVRHPGTFNMDLSLIKDTQVGERLRLQLRAEAFNWLNTVNLGLANGTFTPGPDGFNRNAAFGTINSARQARQIQFGLKLLF